MLRTDIERWISDDSDRLRNRKILTPGFLSDQLPLIPDNPDHHTIIMGVRPATSPKTHRKYIVYLSKELHSDI